MGDPLDNLNKIVDWPLFTPVLDRIPVAKPKGLGGRPAFKPDFIFKILVLQSLYTLSDEQTQFQILDRRSFHRFLDLTESDVVPDQNTIRLFRGTLVKANLLEALFESFRQRLEVQGFITRKGQIVDASFVEVPRQRNRRKDNETIKQGEVPEGWAEQPKRLMHKDLDARWTRKHGVAYFGYKNHLNVDLESKLIIQAVVADASPCTTVGPSTRSRAKGTAPLSSIPPTPGQPVRQGCRARRSRHTSSKKGSVTGPLAAVQQEANRAKSKCRSRVEHVFGFMTVSMKALYRRSIGFAGNRAGVILANLVYNLCRVEQIMRLKILGANTPTSIQASYIKIPQKE